MIYMPHPGYRFVAYIIQIDIALFVFYKCVTPTGYY